MDLAYKVGRLSQNLVAHSRFSVQESRGVLPIAAISDDTVTWGTAHRRA